MFALDFQQEVRTEIEKDLDTICGSVYNNINQVKLFRRTVTSALKATKGKRSCEPDPRTLVGDITKAVKQDIRALNLEGSEHHDRCCEILQSASNNLRLILAKNGKSLKKIRKLVEKEEKAIRLDMEYRNVNHDPPKMHQPDLNLMVHFIDEPEKDPYPLNDKFYSYYDILWYLNDQNIIKAPELWIRENAQKFQIPLPNGLAECWRWKCAVAGEKLSGSVMYGLSMIGRSNYIVALVHAGQDEEFLMSIDVPIFGAEPCSSCNPSCTTLGEHLTNIWTGRYRVFHASKLGNPECSALGKALNSIEFTIRMNELYIRAEKL